MSFLLILFLIIVAIFVFGLSLISSILRTLFGFGRRTSTNTSSSQQQQTTKKEFRQETTSTTQKKKIFDKNDGEYVEFEEVTEEE